MKRYLYVSDIRLKPSILCNTNIVIWLFIFSMYHHIDGTRTIMEFHTPKHGYPKTLEELFRCESIPEKIH